MATVLAGGEAVQVFSDLEQLMQVSDQWPVERRLRAGERSGGAKVAGFDMGISSRLHTGAGAGTPVVH